jgi:thiamine biosynthesis lipoprotein
MSEEAHRAFACFGGTATVHVRGDGTADGEEAADRARRRLLDAHDRLSRFLEDSELTLLNRDPRREVPASPLLRQLAATVRRAGMLSGGLVDATLLDELEGAGYRDSMDGVEGPSISRSPRGAGRRPARPNPAQRWREIHVDEAAGTIARPPGLAIDSGGIAKGLVADLVGAELGGRRAYAVDCCGDIRIGGTAGLERPVLVGDPFGGDPIHELSLTDGAIATTGIGRRRWIGTDGEAAHHLLDPQSGEPAFTGIVQATAIAPSGVLAEVYAKAALLSGPAGAAAWLPHGGVTVDDGGTVELVDAGRPLPEAVAAP